MLVTFGKHTHVTAKNPRVAEEADYLQFLVVLNFLFVFQYTPILVFLVKISAQPHTIVKQIFFPMAMYCFCYCFLYPRIECIM